MSAKILDGKLTATKIQSSIAKKVNERIEKNRRAPGLAVIIVGEDPASLIYVSNKRIACEKLGFYSVAYNLPTHISQTELEDLLDNLNNDERIDGIIVQTPLPAHLDTWKVVEKIRFDKDVDGFHPYNVGRLALRKPLLRPCTPYGIIRLLKNYEIDLKGMHAVVVGSSNTVGRPMALELLLNKTTVTVCHKFTKELAHHIKSADLLIVAIGQPHIISSSWIKDNAIVVDVGITRLSNGKICGDVDFVTASSRASWITPVPGGVGPMTVTTLLENTLYAAENLH